MAAFCCFTFLVCPWTLHPCRVRLSKALTDPSELLGAVCMCLQKSGLKEPKLLKITDNQGGGRDIPTKQGVLTPTVPGTAGREQSLVPGTKGLGMERSRDGKEDVSSGRETGPTRGEARPRS